MSVVATPSMSFEERELAEEEDEEEEDEEAVLAER